MNRFNSFLKPMTMTVFIFLVGFSVSVGETTAPKTPADKLNLRIHHQTAQIQEETKLGKLSKDQAKSLKSQVEAVRKEELADLKASGSKALTDGQLAKLNAELDGLSKSIPLK